MYAFSNARVVSISLFAAACAAPTARPTSSPRADSTNYAVRQMYADSVEQAQIGAFFAEYRTRSLPLQRDGNYLGEMTLLGELAARYPNSKGVQSLAGQQIATYASFLGDFAGAVARFDAIDDEGFPKSDTLKIDGLSAVPAVDAISAIADTARAIFINEAHHVPQTRVLSIALLRHLRAKGFTHFAAETLSPTDSALNTRAYPVHESGFYSNEPVFGQLLREAKRLGFVLVPYEAMGAKSQDERELGQATNLRDRILASAPDARIVVHAGYAHIDESGALAGAKPMALRFRELTGIDPVTIEQTVMFEHPNRSREHPAYRRTIDRAKLDVPFVLRREDGRLWSRRPGVHDVTVFLPPTTLRSGRPNWLWSLGTRKSYTPPDSVCGGRDVCVVTARPVSESGDAVPFDALLVRRGAKTKPALVLAPGQYHVVSRDTSGAVLFDQLVTV